MDWFPWYPGIYSSKTMHLTAEQDGIYRRLIDHYMTIRHPLPDNDAALCRIAGITPECWSHASRIVRAFFTHKKDGLLHHDFCDDQLNAQDNRSKTRSHSASFAAKKRWEKQEVKCGSHAERNADAMRGNATGQDRTIQDSKERTSSEVPKKSPKPPKVSLEQLSLDHVSEWLNQKRALGKHLTIDEQGLLEMFKDYCLSNNKTYADYVAGFRNSFAWDRAPKKGNHNGTLQQKPTHAERLKAAGDAAVDEIVAEYSARYNPPESLAISGSIVTKL